LKEEGMGTGKNHGWYPARQHLASSILMTQKGKSRGGGSQIGRAYGREQGRKGLSHRLGDGVVEEEKQKGCGPETKKRGGQRFWKR